jgi:hypothetical protein
LLQFVSAYLRKQTEPFLIVKGGGVKTGSLREVLLQLGCWRKKKCWQ